MKGWTEPPSWLEWRIVKWLRHPHVQMRLGAFLVVLTTFIWWPLWQWIAKPAGEPEIVYHLSMFAVWLSGLTLAVLTDVGEQVKT